MKRIDAVIKNFSLLRIIKNMSKEELFYLIDNFKGLNVIYKDENREFLYKYIKSNFFNLKKLYEEYKGKNKYIFVYIDENILNIENYNEDDIFLICYHEKYSINSKKILKRVAEVINELSEDEKVKLIPQLSKQKNINAFLKSVKLSEKSCYEIDNYMSDKKLLLLQDLPNKLKVKILEKNPEYFNHDFEKPKELQLELAMKSLFFANKVNANLFTDKEKLSVVKEHINKKFFELMPIYKTKETVNLCLKTNQSLLMTHYYSFKEYLPEDVYQMFDVMRYSNHNTKNKSEFKEIHKSFLTKKPNLITLFSKESILKHEDFFDSLVSKDLKPGTLKYLFTILKNRNLKNTEKLNQLIIKQHATWLNKIKNPSTEVINIAYEANPNLNKDVNLKKELFNRLEKRDLDLIRNKLKNNKSLFKQKCCLSINELTVVKELPINEILSIEISSNTDEKLIQIIQKALEE